MATLLEFPLDETSSWNYASRTAGIPLVARPCDFPIRRYLPVFVEPHAYIRGNEFVAARLVGPDEAGYFSVEVELRETAAKKIDRLAKSPESVGLGVYRRGQAVKLIQAVRGISGRNLAWYGFENKPEAMAVLALFGGVATAPGGT